MIGPGSDKKSNPIGCGGFQEGLQDVKNEDSRLDRPHIGPLDGLIQNVIFFL